MDAEAGQVVLTDIVGCYIKFLDCGECWVEYEDGEVANEIVSSECEVHGASSG
jgi:uncharacterized Fe-S cluster-containing radical SAM superfamily protein